MEKLQRRMIFRKPHSWGPADTASDFVIIDNVVFSCRIFKKNKVGQLLQEPAVRLGPVCVCVCVWFVFLFFVFFLRGKRKKKNLYIWFHFSP